MKKFKVGLVGRIIIAMLLGMLLGGYLPVKVIRAFSTFNGLFSQFLGFIIPLFFPSYSSNTVFSKRQIFCELLKEGLHFQGKYDTIKQEKGF